MPNEVTAADHERIWLQQECCADRSEGRLWCQDGNVFDECEEGVNATEYVRADILATALEELGRLQGELEIARHDLGVDLRAIRDLLEKLDAVEAERDTLRTELADLRRDRERFDWLLNQTEVSERYSSDQGRSTECFIVRWDDYMGEKPHYDLREAIDAAISSTTRSEGEK